MFAAAVAAMGASSFAALCEPEDPVVEQVARIYQMQLNVYTTRGYMATSTIAGSGSICEPGESTEVCTVFRGKDKTVIRGYIYVCQNLCALDDYTTAFVDAKRKAAFGSFEDDGAFRSTATLEWKLLNFMGSKFKDVEAAWNFEGSLTYTYLGAEATQTYKLTGAGYGQVGSGATIFADKLSGNFAGTASASFDCYNKKNSACACEPSKVLTCAGYDELDYQALDTVAFGSWKMKFNANDSKAYLAGKWNPLTALKKILQ